MKLRFVFSILFALLLLCRDIISDGISSNIANQSSAYSFIELTLSNTVLATVSPHSNMPPIRSGVFYISTNTLLRTFFDETAFGERWILEGWPANDSRKFVLYDSHEMFEARATNRKKLKNAAESIPRDKRIQMLQSDNPDERRYANELFLSLWDIHGSSRREVERASDIIVQKHRLLVFELPGILNEYRELHDAMINYVQLRIEPAGTNQFAIIYSNVLVLPPFE